jgi:hypothetical protein
MAAGLKLAVRAGRLLSIMLGVLAAGAASARTPFQIRCEDTISQTVSVLTASQNGYRVNTDLSYKALTGMKNPGRDRALVLGLTQTEFRVRIGLDGAILQDRASGYECIAPRIKVTLSYQPIVVYVGKEFAPGTCAYQEILTHEMRHLNAYMDQLPKVEKVVRAALAKRFENRPLYAPAGQASALLSKEIDTGWMPYIKAQLGKVDQLQAAIDSPQEYARLGKACKGEVGTIIGPAASRR